MRGIEADRNLVGLVSQAQITDSNPYMTNIVPYVCLSRIISQRQRPLKAAQRHIILTRVEAAQAHIIPKLGRGQAALHQSLVEAQGDFRLVRVKVIRGDRCNGFHAVVFVGEHLLVHEEGFARVVKHVVDSGDACKHAWFENMFLLASIVDFDRPLRLVQADSHFGQLNLRHNHLLILER